MRYLGSKDKLIPAIKSLLHQKGLTDRNYIFFDAFCGTGAVANSVKDIYHLVINDSMHWSVLYAKGRIIGNTCCFKTLGFDPFEYFNSHNETELGFIYNNYSPGGSDRMYFSSNNAARIDYIRTTIECWKKDQLITENEYAYLMYCLIESVSSVSNTAGVYGAFLKYWDPRANNPLIIQPLCSDDTNIRALDLYCAKIEDIISSVNCDILYLDPPYTQNQYGTQYHLLETLVLNDNPPISKITGSRPVTPMKSMWSKDGYANILFDYVIAKTTAKYIILSYNNDGFLSKDYIEATLKRYGKPETYSCQEIDYKKYNNFKCRGKDGHIEYLFFIEKKPMEDVVYESPLNYSGSKAKMIPIIKHYLPKSIHTFVDAFGGGFNVGINIDAERIIYNDINPFVVELIQSFSNIDCADYLKAIKKLIGTYNLAPCNKDGYNKLRKIYNDTPIDKRNPVMLYALILFGFQQQIRFNSNFDFNIPCGTRRFNDKLLSKFVSFARVIKEKHIFFTRKSFGELKDYISADSIFYFDPPYRETTATYNDGKRGFEGWDIAHEQNLCKMMDYINAQNGKFIFSYVLKTGDFYNHDIEDWANANSYKIIDVADLQGRYNNRREVLILNY